MSKRKISERQKARIANIQQKRREQAEQTDDQSGLQGLVVARYGKQALVELPDGQTLACLMRQHLGSVVVGDQVIVAIDKPEDGGVITACHPRRNALSRPDPKGELKTIAANIDHVFIVTAPVPEPFAHVIDSYLVAVENLNLPASIVLNKSDLLNGANSDALPELWATYRDIGYEILVTSCVEAHGLDHLNSHLTDQVSVFIGQSGVGKSSLIQHCVPEEALRVGDISTASEKGRHTTTTARLYHLPQGGSIIDSPGIRAFHLWQVDADTIAQGFKEFQAYLGKCRFRNCAHAAEPGCALREALERGDIAASRFDSFQRLCRDYGVS
jgi:ribosome biogenesis GTPase / thiamine phosphate phosphatase